MERVNSIQVRPSRLRAFDLFSELPEGDLHEIAKSCQEVRVPAGALMIRQGQVGREIYFLEQGDACVFKKGSEASSYVAVLRGPNVFGEGALMDPERIRTASVEALTDLQLIAIQIATFIGFLRCQPILANRIKQLVQLRAQSTPRTK